MYRAPPGRPSGLPTKIIGYRNAVRTRSGTATTKTDQTVIGVDMELNENTRVDTSQVDDRRGSGGGGRPGGIPIPIGGRCDGSGRGGLTASPATGAGRRW